MDFLLGLLTAVVFFVALMAFFYMGVRYGRTKPPDKSVDEEEQRKAKQHREDFMKLMNYDVDKALQRKRVT